MQILTNSNKCLFGGALVAAGLATHKAHAQEFQFIDTTATANVVAPNGGGLDSFSGPGPWSVYSYYRNFFTFGYAQVWGTPTSLNTYVWGGGYDSEVSVDSHFTVTSNTFATLFYNMPTYSDAYSDLAFTDLTTGIVLLSVNDDGGSQVFELLAEHEYRFLYSATNFSMVNLTIPERCPADLNSDGTLNYFDVSAFLVAFGAMDPAADFNNDGAFNFFDVSAFLTAFAAGCP